MTVLRIIVFPLLGFCAWSLPALIVPGSCSEVNRTSSNILIVRVLKQAKEKEAPKEELPPGWQMVGEMDKGFSVLMPGKPTVLGGADHDCYLVSVFEPPGKPKGDQRPAHRRFRWQQRRTS